MNTQSTTNDIAGGDSSPVTHELKTWPEYFQKVKSGEKAFEVRRNDRNYKVGDTLILKEWNPSGYSSVSPNLLEGEYTGDELRVKVTYVLKVLPHEAALFGISSDSVVMSIQSTPPKEGVEQAAEDMAKKLYQTYPESNEIHRMNVAADRTIFIAGFLAGATWQAGQDRGEGWVSVEHRLPEDEGDYFVCKQYGEGRQQVKTSFFRKDHNCFDDFLENIITHWMPLPKPPQSKSK